MHLMCWIPILFTGYIAIVISLGLKIIVNRLEGVVCAWVVISEGLGKYGSIGGI